jgi:hypothetical protein
VEQAVAEMGQNCADMTRNSACYGHDLVETAFLETIDDETFSEPSDRAELNLIDTIRTAPLSLEDERWGIAVMNVQANVPNTLPGQAVTFVLMGDAEIENRVAPEDVTPDAEAVPVAAAVRSNVRSGPGTNNNVIGVVDAGAQFEADVLSEDGAWARVILNGRIGWLAIEVLESEADLAALPVVTAPVVSPMQAFYFTTGISQPECAEAPDVIAIRSPEGMTVDLSVNGVDIRVGSLITLRQVSENEIVLTVHEGSVETQDDDGDYNPVTGDSLPGALGEDGTIIDWEPVREATEDELALGVLFEDQLVALEVDFGTEAVVDAPVQTGGSVNCAGFAATSPTLGFGFGFNQFFWNAAQGADNYRVIVYNEETGQTFGGETGGPTTSLGLTLDNTTAGAGFSFSWEVQALRAGRVICTSQRIRLQRAAVPTAPQPVGPAPVLSANWACINPAYPSYTNQITWSDAAPGDTVSITVVGMLNGTQTFGSLPSSGSLTYSDYQTYSISITASPSGQTYNIPGPLNCY